MPSILQNFAKNIRQVYMKISGSKHFPVLASFAPQYTQEQANELIKNSLLNETPLMISRFGICELQSLVNWMEMQNTGFEKYYKYITNQTNNLAWNQYVLNTLVINAGFFPKTEEAITRYSEMFIEDIKEIDILGSWTEYEKKVEHLYSPNLKTVGFEDLDPFYYEKPWTKALENKKVLIIYPFEDSIIKQYQKRELLFENPDMLPQFELKTIKAIQTVAGNNHDKYKDWFEALDIMKKQIDETDFDIAIIGAGAYGLPLAAHCKRIGKKGFHYGGATQLLFGIMGRRWEEASGYKNKFKFQNEHWIRPSEDETPKNTHLVEGSTYW
jgi:hypothetical protein